MEEQAAEQKDASKDLKDRIIDYLKAHGGDAGNIAIMRALKVGDDQYWRARDRLIDEGRVIRARARGGKVILVEIKPVEPVAEIPVPATGAAAMAAHRFASEDTLYDPIAKGLTESWTKDNRYRESIVEITARQGRRDTGGTWSRPDITVVGMTTYLYLPGRYFDVTTFEVKKSDSLNVTGVFEALAHRRAATRAYAVFHVPGLVEGDAREAAIGAISDEAKKHGIGVILVVDPDDFGTWEEIVEPTRVAPNPEDLNDFIALQLSNSTKEEVVQWFK